MNMKFFVLPLSLFTLLFSQLSDASLSAEINPSDAVEFEEQEDDFWVEDGTQFGMRLSGGLSLENRQGNYDNSSITEIKERNHAKLKTTMDLLVNLGSIEFGPSATYEASRSKVQGRSDDENTYLLGALLEFNLVENYSYNRIVPGLGLRAGYKSVSGFGVSPSTIERLSLDFSGFGMEPEIFTKINFEDSNFNIKIALGYSYASLKGKLGGVDATYNQSAVTLSTGLTAYY